MVLSGFLALEDHVKHKNQSGKTLTLLTDRTVKKCSLFLIFVLLLLGASPGWAEEKSADQWQYDFQIYLWAPTLKNNTVTGDKVTINFGTILKNLDFTAMMTFGARNNKFSMLADVLYLDISDSKKHEGHFLGQPVTGKLKVGLEAWVLNFIGGYNLIDNGKNQFDITAGARYLKAEVPVSFKPDDDVTKYVGKQGQVWDGVIGFKGRHHYPDGHYLNYYADVGGGDSKLTWQAMVNFAYDYKKFTGIIGYRYLKWNFKNDAPALDDMTVHGPYMALKWSF